MSAVYLLRGIGGSLFSGGLDMMAADMRRRGIPAEVSGYRAYPTVTARVLNERPGKVVLIGHSQGSNNLILTAMDLGRHSVAVDLLVTLCPVGRWHYPQNVRRALNLFTGTWGNSVPAADPTKTHVMSVDYQKDWSVWHLNITQHPAIQKIVLTAVYQTLGASLAA